MQAKDYYNNIIPYEIQVIFKILYFFSQKYFSQCSWKRGSWNKIRWGAQKMIGEGVSGSN